MRDNLKIKYYDKIIKKHKISSKVALLKLNDLITVSNSTKLQITYYDQNKKIIKLKNDIIKKSILFLEFNFEQYLDLFKNIKSDKNIILVNMRRPAFTDLNSLKLLKKDRKSTRLNSSHSSVSRMPSSA